MWYWSINLVSMTVSGVTDGVFHLSLEHPPYTNRNNFGPVSDSVILNFIQWFSNNLYA